MNRKYQLIAGLLVCLMIVTMVAGCGQATEEPAPEPAPTEAEAAPEPAAEEPEEALRVAAVFPGTINDEGFNQAGYEGLLMIEEQLGAEIAFSELTPVADFVNTYRDFADQGYDIIIGHGFEFGDPAMEVAPDYPDIKFIVDSNPVVSAENVAGITGKTWESAYLLGVIAGLMTETGKIGGIAGFDFPILIAQMEAYRLGAESVRPDVDVTTVYIGSFEDVSQGKEAALAQASADVDVIFHIADAAGVGVIQAIEEAGIWGLGWGLDQNHLAPDNILSSLLFSGGELLLQDVEKVVDGSWTGDVRLYGLDTGVIGIADYHGLVPDDVAAQVEEVKEKIISGEVEVPYIPEVGGGGAELPESEQAASGEPLRVAAVFPGTINDQGFNQAGYEGLLMIEEELGAEIAFSELTPVADFVNTYRDFADQGYDIIIGHGFEFGDPAMEVAPDYPDIKFIVDSNPVVSAENVAGITGKTWESAYLLGVIAGLMTETGKIGGIAGFDFPILIAQMEAYRLGAESVRPDVDVTTVYIGSFEDVSQGKEAALAQASADVDVIFHIADAAGVGVIQAIEEAGIWGLGWGLDQNHLAPDNILSSLLFSGGELLLQDVEKVVDGSWTGDVRLYGLDTAVIGIADYHGLVPDDVAAQVEEAKQQIISGEIEVPYIEEASE
ncbi:BMP family protein [Chloroflexota bacterium]